VKIISYFHFLAVLILLIIGLSAIIFKKNLIKIVIGISVMGSSVNLFLISLGYRSGGVAPIFTNAPKLKMVLPTPQALTLTNIVIDLAIVAFMLSLVILIYKRYGSLDVRDGRLRG